MLRKACMSGRKDQPMPESGGTSFLPGLLVGFAKGMADADSARSPTSPLDCRLFSGLGGSHFATSPGAADAARKSWGRDRVGLGLVDSLGGTECRRRVLLGSPENRRILLGSQTRIDIPCPKTRLDRLLADDNSAASPKSLPKNYYVIFSHNRNNASPCFEPGGSPEKVERASAARLELDEHGNNIQSRRSPHIRRSPSPSSEPKNATPISPPFAEATKFETCSTSLPDDLLYGFLGSLSADDFEQSEDYTCIISHGPNPKTTRIFGGWVLESRRTGAMSGCSDGGDRRKGEEGGGCLWTVKCFENPTNKSFPAAAGEDLLFLQEEAPRGRHLHLQRREGIL